MPAIGVRICARGDLTDGDRFELPGFEERRDGAFVVLDGAVVDHPALVGVLERLRRSGLRIRDVELVAERPVRSRPGHPGAVARVAFRGNVADLLRLSLREAHIVDEVTTTTVEVDLPDDGAALFEALARVELLALEFTEIHVHPARVERESP